MPKVDTRKMLEYKEQLDSAFSMYVNDISPLIVRFEVEKGEFPIEVLNEIRAIYNHLACASLSQDDDEVKYNVEKIGSHSKRALLDCFKYICMLCGDEYDAFMARYKGVDLTFIENGEFLRDIVKLRKAAIAAFLDAKNMESLHKGTNEEVFIAYQNSYNLFEKLKERLCQAEETAAFLEQKAAVKNDREIAFGLIGLIGFIATIVGLFACK